MWMDGSLGYHHFVHSPGEIWGIGTIVAARHCKYDGVVVGRTPPFNLRTLRGNLEDIFRTLVF